MVIAFLVAWTPYAIFALIKQFGNEQLVGPGLAILPSLIAKSSICYNPIIYVGMNSQVYTYTYAKSSETSVTLSVHIILYCLHFVWQFRRAYSNKKDQNHELTMGETVDTINTHDNHNYSVTIDQSDAKFIFPFKKPLSSAEQKYKNKKSRSVYEMTIMTGTTV